METTALYIDDSMKVNRWMRLANFLLDIVFYYILSLLIGVVFGLLALTGIDGPLIWITEADPLTSRLLGIAIILMYYLFTESITQRSIAKFITGTMVVMEDGSRPEARTIFLRTICRFIPFEPFSFFGSDERGWHDSITNTYVVNTKKYKEAIALKNSFEEIGNSEFQNL